MVEIQNNWPTLHCFEINLRQFGNVCCNGISVISVLQYWYVGVCLMRICYVYHVYILFIMLFTDFFLKLHTFKVSTLAQQPNRTCYLDMCPAWWLLPHHWRSPKKTRLVWDLYTSRQLDADKLWWQSLLCSWTSSLELSADVYHHFMKTFLFNHSFKKHTA